MVFNSKLLDELLIARLKARDGSLIQALAGVEEEPSENILHLTSEETLGEAQKPTLGGVPSKSDTLKGFPSARMTHRHSFPLKKGYQVHKLVVQRLPYVFHDLRFCSVGASGEAGLAPARRSRKRLL